MKAKVYGESIAPSVGTLRNAVKKHDAKMKD
jgi:hypothetical protein